MDRAWFAVRAKPRREMEAEENLRAQGFAAWCPRIRKRVRHARRETVKLAPLFPGYLFVQLGPEERRWTTIRSTRGVAYVVCFGGRYPEVPAAFIAELQARADANGVIAVNGTQPEARLAPGDLVRVRTGALAGLLGIVERLRDADRIIVLMELLQREVRVELPVHGVEVEERRR